MSTDSLVTVDNFRMDFGKTTVIRDLSFTVARGETFGFLGSNGSGKTTTIRALLGIYQPTGGTLTIDGAPYSVDSGVKLGYLPEERGLYKKEPVIDIMTYFGQLKGVPRADARKWSTEYLARVELSDKARVRLDKLSGGQQQKVQLGITIMNDPALLILDEPTKGFDPVNRRLLMDIIEEHQSRGATVVFVTHQMEEVERLCDRVLLLKDGQAELYGTVDEVKASFGQQVLEITTPHPIPENPTLYSIQRQEGSTAYLTPVGELNEIQSFLTGRGVYFTQFNLKRPSLDDIFVTVYGTKDGRESNHA